MRKLKLFLFILGFLNFSAVAFGQAQTLCPAGTWPYPNDPTTGTTQFTLSKLTSSGNAVIMATTDNTGFAGVVIQGAGTSGTVCLARVGIWPVKTSNTATAQHYVQISSGTGGDGADTGATTYPVAGGDVIGRVQSYNSTAGIAMVDLGPETLSSCVGIPATFLDTAATVTVGGANCSEFHNNQNATAATAITYNLPTAAQGLQRCFTNSYNGSAADTGVLTVATSASGQFIIFTDGTLSATGGNVTSGGAAADAACVVGVDATHWQLYVQRGTWTKH